MQRGTCRPTNRCQLQREQWRRTIDAVPTETSSEDIPTADAELSPAMLRRLERVSAEEESAGMDPLVADPAVDVDMYRRAMRRRVAESVLTRHRIYLDMNYWIWLRDAALGQPARPIYADLWEHRIQLVRSGRVLCPVSYPVYREVLKQDSASRQRTALVIDQLCGGVCIVLHCRAARADHSSAQSLRLDRVTWRSDIATTGSVHLGTGLARRGDAASR